MNNTSIAFAPTIKSKATAALISLAVGLAFSTAMPLPLHAQQSSDVSDIPLVPIMPPKPAEFVGIWNYTSSQPTVTGRCPAGDAMQGQLSISYDSAAPESPENMMEGPVSLDILSGSVCDPASLCHLQGVISNNAIAVGASDTVDDEGGEAIVSWALWFTPDKTAYGEVSSNYSHPSGFNCDWNVKVQMTRPEG